MRFLSHLVCLVAVVWCGGRVQAQLIQTEPAPRPPLSEQAPPELPQAGEPPAAPPEVPRIAPPPPEEHALVAPPNEPAALSEQRMSALLGVFAQSARATRRFLLYTAYGSAIALLPAGIVLEHRHNALQRQTGIGMIVGGAAPLAFSLLWSRPSTMEQLYNSYESMRVPGADNRELVHRTEQAWQEAAERAYKRRKLSGAISLVLGLAATVTGVTFLLRDHVGGMSHNAQYTLGSSLIGPGVPVATNGTRSLIMPSTEEVGWAAYRAATLNYGAPLRFGALRHGGVASSGFTF